MTEEEIEVVARTIKAVLWENAEVIYDQTGFSEPDNSVGLDGGNDARVSDLIARAAITALDQHREGEKGEAPAWALKAMPGLVGEPKPYTGPFGASPTKEEGR